MEIQLRANIQKDQVGYPTWSCVSNGGDKGIRTPDLLTASQALSQLSYIPGWWAMHKTPGRLLFLQYK